MRHNKGLIILLSILAIALCGIIFWAAGGIKTYEADASAIVANTGQKESTKETTKETEDTPGDTEIQTIEESIEEIQTNPVPETETEPVASSVHLMFAGDVLLSNHVLNAYDKAGNIEGVVDGKLLEAIHQSDIFMVNEEFPFSDRGTAAEDKQYTFRLAPSRIHMMKEMGIDIVTLANNHALDFGRDALLDTCQTLENAGILYVGAGENMERAKQLMTMDAGGKTIGFLGASRVIPESDWTAGSDTPGMLTTYDPAILLKEIGKAKEICDYVVVYVHWGIEREEYPKEYQRTLGQQYIDAGADLVIGSHPHVLQGFEYYKGKPIVYSLGNFVFGSSIPKTMLLDAKLDGDEISLSIIPATSSAGYTRAVTGADTLKEFYSYLESISYGVQISDGVVAPASAQP